LRNYATRSQCTTAEPNVSLFSAGAAVRYCPIRDRALIAWSVVWTAFVLVVFGLVAAIIPNPIFGRGLAPEPFAVAVWLVSAPLMGVVMATYFAPMPAGAPVALGIPVRRDGTTAGTLGGFVAFLAIGCPTCNKIALILPGASGAANVFGPIQPVLGAISLALLTGTLVWRMRLRARGGSCFVPQRRPSKA
jgi:hypothetical protein